MRGRDRSLLVDSGLGITSLAAAAAESVGAALWHCDRHFELIAQVTGQLQERVGKIKHAVTHHRITLYGFAARPQPPDAVPIPSPQDCAALRWESLDALDGYAFSSPQALLRNALLAHAAQEQTGAIQHTLSFD